MLALAQVEPTEIFLRKRWANLFGTPNTAGAGLICKIISYLVETCGVGWDTSLWAGVAGTGGTKCVVVWGNHCSHSCEPAWWSIKEAKKAGTKIITIDPRFTEEAAIADVWVPLRPGTDVALAMGMAHVIINEGLIDKEFIKNQTVGYDKLVERVKDYPPEKVAEICWITKDKVIEAGRTFGTYKPGCIMWGVACDQIGHNQVYLSHARTILRAITGNIDVPGANTLSGPVPKIRIRGSMELNDSLSPTQKKKKIGAERFRFTSWQCYDLIEPKLREYWDHPEGALETEWLMDSPWPLVIDAALTGKPYPIKALLCQSNNPVICYPGTQKAVEVLVSGKIELCVVNDFFLTPTASLSDYVLPAASHLEDDYCYIGMDSMMDLANFHQKVVEPLGERKPDLYLWRELGMRLGQEKYWPFKTTAEMWTYTMERLGITYEEIMEKDNHYIVPPLRFRKFEETDPKTGKPRGWATPTGKIEITCTVFEKLGYDPLPYHEESGESPYSTPELAKEYPIILTTGGRVKQFYHSEHRQLKSMRSMHPWPLLDVNPEWAYDNGIAEGDWVYIETPTGKCKMKAHYNAGIHYKVVHAEHSWWYPESDMNLPYLGGAFDCNINNVIPTDPDYFDRLSGAFVLRSVMCKVYRAKESFEGQCQFGK